MAKQMVHCTLVKLLLSMGEDATLNLWITILPTETYAHGF